MPEDMIKSPLLWDTMRKGLRIGLPQRAHDRHVRRAGARSPGSPHGAGGNGLGKRRFRVAIGVSCFPAFFACMLPNDLLEETIIYPFCQNRDATFIGCWAITEPNHGTDQVCPGTEVFRDPDIKGQLKARLDGDEWVINGQKSAWVSNGPIATHALAYLNIDPSMGLAGGGICIIPLDKPGVSRGRALNKLGQRALSQGEIYFDDVRVPERLHA